MIHVDVALKRGAFDLDVAFDNDAGITALFGRSGAGKSMTISLIAGLETDTRPLAEVSIDLDGHGALFALVTRKAIDELGLGRGDRVFALVKSVALDERAAVSRRAVNPGKTQKRRSAAR